MERGDDHLQHLDAGLLALRKPAEEAVALALQVESLLIFPVQNLRVGRDPEGGEIVFLDGVGAEKVERDAPVGSDSQGRRVECLDCVRAEQFRLDADRMSTRLLVTSLEEETQVQEMGEGIGDRVIIDQLSPEGELTCP